MRFTPHHREMNRQLHDKDEFYGSEGYLWSKHVEEVATRLNTTSILDYGCGRGTLARVLEGLPIREYDIAVPGKDADPEPADVVVCTDVLEHVEPECLDAVLDHLQALTKKLLIASIHIGPAGKKYPDGTNAHKTQQTARWWVDIFNKRWSIAQLEYPHPKLWMLVRPVEVSAEAPVTT